MHSTRALETVCADAWPAMAEQDLGEWRMRAAGGYTGRANSTLALGDPGMPVGAALDAVTDFSRAHGIRPYLQVVSGSAVEAELRAHGWDAADHARGAETHVLTAPAGPGSGGGAGGGEVSDAPPAGWLEVAVGGEPTAAQRHVLTGGPRVGFATARADGEIAGVARGCVVGDFLHIAVLEVLPRHRRRGHATALMAALSRWAGSPHRVLQVATANTGAVALYRRAGFTEAHRYRYWARG
ncbi:GNAT family N-acetyltransferase [Actinokineospora guangxiensis]|uniref:GNAT family N-acetyltransferase n=1 Tax=Actinokineospora guangxiensis TaxID=1490288 RepID=A0ABW0EIQ8_9PSEU